MTQEYYLLARNDWSASFILKRVKQKRYPETVLFSTYEDAISRKKKMRLIDQEEFSVFKVHYTKSTEGNN